MKQLPVTQPPFESTQAGLLRGVADALGLSLSTPAIYGGSGLGFVLNIHRSLCPSGPYCFDRQPLDDLLRGMGIEATSLGYFDGGATPDQRSQVEEILRKEISEGRPGGLVNMEFQLVTGFDESGFFTAQPWDCADFPPSRLTFGTWEEFGNEIHVDFYRFSPCQPVSPREWTLKALDFAIAQLQQEPDPKADYGMGLQGYDHWITAVPEHGASHGAWWNGRVWSECRKGAGEWLAELGREHQSDLAKSLAEDYLALGRLLAEAAVKELAPEPKVEKLREARALEAAALPKLAALRAELESSLAG